MRGLSMRRQYEVVTFALLVSLTGMTAALAQNTPARIQTRPITEGLNRRPVDSSGQRVQPSTQPKGTGSVESLAGRQPLIQLNQRCFRDVRGVVRCR
jgi:hypothetical protein